MLQFLIDIDHRLLLLINGAHCPLMDSLMWYVSQSATWIPLYALIIWALWHRFGMRRTLILTLLLLLAVGLSDFTASGIIKPLVCRFRPTHHPALMDSIHLVRGYQGGLYGFVSSHAANTFSLALLCSLWFRNKKATLGLMTWVALNCYSRMYLGVHFPADIVGGLIVGGSWALLIDAAVRRWWPCWRQASSPQQPVDDADHAPAGS